MNGGITNKLYMWCLNMQTTFIERVQTFNPIKQFNIRNSGFELPTKM